MSNNSIQGVECEEALFNLISANKSLTELNLKNNYGVKAQIPSEQQFFCSQISDTFVKLCVDALSGKVIKGNFEHNERRQALLGNQTILFIG